MKAIFLLVGQALAAIHLIQVISIDEYIHRRLSQPEDNFPLLGLDPQSQEHFRTWMSRLIDPESLQVVGPCRPHPAAAGSIAPPYPLFPGGLPDAYRNKLLRRPAPDIVRVYIEQATDGKLSTVDELVERVNANLDDLSVLGADELTLLATNFNVPKAGLATVMGCGPAHYDGWPEDLIVSRDEQRALLAGFLYIVGDEGYLARRDETLRQHLWTRYDSDARFRKFADQERGSQRSQEQEPGSCEASVSRGVHLFQERIERLAAEVLISETEWLARYDECVAALRAELYDMVPVSDGNRAWDSLAPKVEAVVSAAEDAADLVIEKHILREEPGYCLFLDHNQGSILGQFPELRHSLVRRVAYRRWNVLTPEDQAVYIAGGKS